MKLTPRRNIERATSFKVQYLSGGQIVCEREFKTAKSMSQWIARNDENAYDIFILKTLALILGEWEPFTTIGKKTTTLSDLQTIVKDLSEDYKPSKFEK